MTEKKIISINDLSNSKVYFGVKKYFLDHKILVYTVTLSEYQHGMRYRLILEEFGLNIQNIDWVQNI